MEDSLLGLTYSDPNISFQLLQFHLQNMKRFGHLTSNSATITVLELVIGTIWGFRCMVPSNSNNIDSVFIFIIPPSCSFH